MENNKKKRNKKGIIIAIVFTVVLLIAFLIELFLALKDTEQKWNYVLLTNGLVDFIVAFIIFKIYDHINKYTCPECGAKREHHRALIDTDEKKWTSQPAGRKNMIDHTQYTFIYHDTYVCSECGETLNKTVKKPGGLLLVWHDDIYTDYMHGHVFDQRKTPKEF